MESCIAPELAENKIEAGTDPDKRGLTLHDIDTCDQLKYCASACLGGFGSDNVSPWEIFCGEAFDGKFSRGNLRCDCRCCSGKLWINFATPFRAASPTDRVCHFCDLAPASSTLATVSDDGGNDDEDSTNLSIFQICQMESFGSSLSLDLLLQSYRDASSLVDDALAASFCGASLSDDASSVSWEPAAEAPEPLISRTNTCVGVGNDSYPPLEKIAHDTATHHWDSVARLGIAPITRNIENGIMFG